MNLNKMIREGRNNGMIGKQKITLTDDSLNVETEFHSSRFKLGSINQIVETTEYIFLYLTSMSALVIPQPAFRNSKKDEFLEKVRIFVM
ncbi:YcxB family protein [Leptospira stimsonii]|uniref:YcxB family protein n=1 Tax=Leptospira stimsonii TaxID=2202203 RepID=UPI0019D57FE9|nr:YcxB family protein [Leptospira stimsonii]